MELRNQVRLIGHLGIDPIVKETKNGKFVRFSMATSEYYKEKGQTMSRTEWHNVVAWNENAEIISAKCKKGTEVIVNGRLTSRSYEDQEKIRRYVTEVVVNEIICRQKDETC